MSPEFERSLCFSCKHRRDVLSKRGSTFWLCLKSKEDKRFGKYPPQPVFQCPGHLPKAEV